MTLRYTIIILARAGEDEAAQHTERSVRTSGIAEVEVVRCAWNDDAARPSSEARTGMQSSWRDAVRLATGDYVVTVLAGDAILAEGFRTLVQCIVDADGPVLPNIVYGDDIVAGRRRNKPGWSPELLRSHDYIGRAFAVRRAALIEALKTAQVDFEVEMLEVLYLVSEQPGEILHVPSAVLECRESERSPHSVDRYREARKAATQRHCDRTGLTADVEIHPSGAVNRLRRSWASMPLVSIVIPTRGGRATEWGERQVAVVECVKSICARSTWTPIEIVVVEDKNTPDAVRDSLDEIATVPIVHVPYKGAFNFSRKINLGVAAASADLLVLLNDDTQVIEPQWLEELLGPLQDGDVGMTGACLLYGDSTIQHGGQFWSRDPGHLLAGLPDGELGYLNAAVSARECAGVTAACAAVRREDFVDVGGFSESLPVNFNDVDFSLKLRSRGLRIVWVPGARLWHFESTTRDPHVLPEELEALRSRWAHELVSDPYFVPDMLCGHARLHFAKLCDRSLCM